MSNFFALLSLPESYSINLDILEKAYFSLQRTWHPDRFAGKPSHERMQAMQQSMTINEAYHTLKSPLKRAQYLLSLQDVIVGTEKDTIKPPASLLIESMESREELADAGTLQEIQALHQKNNTHIEESMHRINQLYDKQNYAQAAEETLRLGYLYKLKQEMTGKLKHMQQEK